MLYPFYSLGIKLYLWAVKIASIKSTKAQLFLSGRKDWRGQLQAEVNKRSGKEWIWFHASSLGEFEQARPVIEKVKANHQEFSILLTFFSPSGYEVRKNFEGVDYVAYLPIDTAKNARDFLSIVPVKIALFVKYEFWLNFFTQLHTQKIPLILFSVILRENHWLIKYASVGRKMFSMTDTIYVQDEFTYTALTNLAPKVILTGDTRFDRVYENSLRVGPINRVQDFIGNKKCLVIGSAWQPELEIVLNLSTSILKDWKIIIAPHEIHREDIENFKAEFKGQVSVWSESDKYDQQSHVLWIDTIGLLMDMYQYANVAVVGGGFGKNIHNVLEPIAFGAFTVIGPKNKNFNEAREGMQFGVIEEIHERDINALLKSFNHLKEKEVRANCDRFIKANVGSSEKIEQRINEILE